MARHRQTTHATHRLTATRDEQVGTGGAGGKEPVYEETTVVDDAPVRFDAGGRSFVREDMGAVLERDPTVTGRPSDLTQLREGDEVELEPIDPDDDETLDRLEVRRITSTYDRRARPARMMIELERVA